MATQSIAWGDGSGQNITLTYAAASGNQTVAVSSPPNLGISTRSKVITFKTTAGGSVVKTITVTQQGRNRAYSSGYSNGYL